MFIHIFESYFPPSLQDTCRCLHWRRPQHHLGMRLMVLAFPRRRHREPGRSWPGKTYGDMMCSFALYLIELIGIVKWTAWITYDETLYHSTRSVFVKRRSNEFDEWWRGTRGLISMCHSSWSMNGSPGIKTRWPIYSWRRTGTRRMLGMVGIGCWFVFLYI